MKGSEGKGPLLVGSDTIELVLFASVSRSANILKDIEEIFMLSGAEQGRAEAVIDAVGEHDAEPGVEYAPGVGCQRLKRGPFVLFNVVPCDCGLALDKLDGIKPVQALRSWIRSVSQGCRTVC